MPFNGSGTYSPPSPPNFPAISGAVITAAYYNNVINDIASGLTACITRDGQGGPSAAINWNGQNLTNVATFGAVTGSFSGALSAASGTFSGLVSITSSGLRLANNLPLEMTNSGGTNLSMLVLTGSNNLQFGPSGAFVGSHEFYSGGSLRAIIDPNGRLGINTASPLALLHINQNVSGANSDTARISGSLGAAGQGHALSWFQNSTTIRSGFIGCNANAGGGQTELHFGTSSSLAASNATTRMILDGNGRLGIGLTPAFQLDVKGATDTTHALIAGVTKGIRFQTTTTDSLIEGVDQTGGGSYQPLSLGGSQVSISQSGSEVARFSSTNLRVLGNVFVGSVSAGNQLATLASPTFTGTPAAPTAANGTNTTQLATTAFVQSQLTANAYAPLASPTFTGTPAAPTAANGTNTTQIATTAFVQSQLAANAYAPLASPALTGTPTTGGIEIGYRNIPRVTGGVDAGKCNAISAGLTLNTGPAAGTTYSIYNDSAAAVTITQGAGLTLRLGGTATTGNRTLAARGFATVWYNSTTEAIMQGSGVS